MNTRIQTLLAKFKETESTHRGAQVLIGLDEIEKFAELIVKECIDTVLDSTVEHATRPQIAEELKEHFGVEE